MAVERPVVELERRGPVPKGAIADQAARRDEPGRSPVAEIGLGGTEVSPVGLGLNAPPLDIDQGWHMRVPVVVQNTFSQPMRNAQRAVSDG